MNPSALLARRALRFGVVGGVSFAVDIGLLLLLVPAVNYLVANTMAFAIANLVNFALGHFWAFRTDGHSPGVRESYLKVLTVSVIGLGLNDLLMFVFVDQLAFDVIPAKLITTGLVLVWNFSLRHVWIYGPVADLEEQ